METRILSFHHKDAIGNETRMQPTYYIEANYTPVVVRIHAEVAPSRDAKVDIYDDDVTIFNNRTPLDINPSTGRNQSGAAVTAQVLCAGQNKEELAGDFATDLIEEGSWVHCNIVDSGGGKNFSVHLELQSLEEGIEDSN